MRFGVLLTLVFAIQQNVNPLLELPRIYNPPIPFPITVMRESLGTALQAADYMVTYLNQTAEELQNVLGPDGDEMYEEELRTWARAAVQQDRDDIEDMLVLLSDLKQESIDQGFELTPALRNVDLYSAQLTELLSLYQSLS
jgi:hypothetical protein